MKHLLAEPIVERADQLVHAVYDVLPRFPATERFALVQQIQRSAMSIPSNIIEGYARVGGKTYQYHATVAYGSLMELKYQLYFSCKRGFITPKEYQYIWNIMDEVGKMLWSAIQTLLKQSDH